jgi:putative IMPACT (imprinted ancient) family translation regulator
LKSNSKIAKATHNILAYRLVKTRNDTSKVKIPDSIVIQDYDDDGETAAGGRLLKLLENCGCENVAVVVSRWYGGVKLGPDRFKDINTVARDLLEKHGFIKGAK